MYIYIYIYIYKRFAINHVLPTMHLVLNYVACIVRLLESDICCFLLKRRKKSDIFFARREFTLTFVEHNHSHT